MDQGVLVALALDAALTLGKVSRPPRAVQVMECHKPVLHIGASAHLSGAAQQDTHLAGADLGEQLLFPHFGVGLMDKGNLIGGHSLGDELLPDVLVDGKDRLRFVQRHSLLQRMKRGVVQCLSCLFGRGRLGRGNVAEYQLGQLVGLAVPPDLHDVCNTLVDLGAGFVRQRLIDNALVQTQLAAIAGDLEHIILGGVHSAAVYQRGALGQRLHHFLLLFGGLGHNVVVFHLRGGQIQLIGGLNVSNFAEQVHQLREIEKLGEAGARPVASAFRCQLQRRRRFTKARRPAVKVGHTQFLQAVILKIPLHGVKLGHGVADRGAGGKDNPSVAGDLVHVAALGEHIAGLLGIAGGEARHIPHLGV